MHTHSSLKASPTVRQSVKISLGASGVSADFMTFHDLSDRKEHVALCFGDWREQEAPFVRIHSECLTGDVFGSTRCDCGPQLQESKELFSKIGGIILYLRQEGRGIGLYNKIDAYALQDLGHDTYVANEMLSQPAEARTFTVAAEMLKALGKGKIRLLSNNPAKAQSLEEHGVKVVEQKRTGVFITKENAHYLRAKVLKAGHRLTFKEEPICSPIKLKP